MAGAQRLQPGVPEVARRLRVPMRAIDYDSAAVRSFHVGAGAFADGRRVRELPLAERAWVSTIVRAGKPRRVDGGTVLTEGDEVHVLAREADSGALRRIFGGR